MHRALSAAGENIRKTRIEHSHLQCMVVPPISRPSSALLICKKTAQSALRTLERLRVEGATRLPISMCGETVFQALLHYGLHLAARVDDFGEREELDECLESDDELSKQIKHMPKQEQKEQQQQHSNADRWQQVCSSLSVLFSLSPQTESKTMKKVHNTAQTLLCQILEPQKAALLSATASLASFADSERLFALSRQLVSLASISTRYSNVVLQILCEPLLAAAKRLSQSIAKRPLVTQGQHQPKTKGGSFRPR